MEIVLQWLDDLEDLIFAMPLLWERLRLKLLHFGLLAALALHADRAWNMAAWWVPVWGLIASIVAIGWFAALAAAQARNRLSPVNPD